MAILDNLKAKRGESSQQNYNEDTNAARTYFGGDFGRADANGAFVYRKGGKQVIYKSDKEVAIHWCKLLGESEDVQSKWEGTQA